MRFVGYVMPEQLAASLDGVAGVVMPSLGGEVFGLVAAEQMLQGRLVIVSDLGALREVVGEAGLVFRTGDAEELAACLRRVCDSPELIPKLGRMARARALAAFGDERVTDEHLSLYRTLLEDGVPQ